MIDARYIWIAIVLIYLPGQLVAQNSKDETLVREEVLTTPKGTSSWKYVWVGHSSVGFEKVKVRPGKDSSVVARFLPPTYRSPIQIYDADPEGVATKVKPPKLLLSRQYKMPKAIAGLGIRIAAKSKLSSRYLLLSSSNEKSVVPVIVNRLGEIIWFLDPTKKFSAWFDFAVFRKIGGDEYGVMLQREQNRFFRVNLLGDVREEITFDQIPKDTSLHHDFLTEKDKVLFLGNSAVNKPICSLAHHWQGRSVEECKSVLPDQELTISGVSILSFGKETGNVMKEVWNAFSSFDVYSLPSRFMAWPAFDPALSYTQLKDRLSQRVFYVSPDVRAHIDWLHVNTLTYSIAGDYLLLSRNTGAVVWISKDFKQVLKSIRLPSSNTFTYKNCEESPRGPHTVSELSESELMMFDNGAGGDCESGTSNKEVRPKLHSRIVSYKLDPKTKVYGQSWSFTPLPHLYSEGRGSVYPVSNDRLLAYFPDANRQGKDIVIEIDRKKNREVARMTITHGGPFTGYRAEPITSLYE